MFDFLKMMQILLKAELTALFKLYCSYSNYNRCLKENNTELLV